MDNSHDEETTQCRKKQRIVNDRHNEPSGIPTKSMDNTTPVSRTYSVAPACNTTTLYVGNLHPRISQPHIEKLFQPYGEIVRINQIKPMKMKESFNTTRTGVTTSSSSNTFVPYGYTFVQFNSIESARLAMQKIDQVTLLGKQLIVRPAHSQNNQESNSVSQNSDTIFSSQEQEIISKN